MKIMHYVHSFGGYSGATKQAISLSLELEKLGCEQIFVSESIGINKKTRNTPECIYLEKGMLGVVRFLYQLIIFRPQVVHFHGASFKYLFFASFFSKVFWKTTLNGDDDFDSLINNVSRFRSYTKKFLLRFIDLNNSLTIQNYKINSKYIKENKIVTIPNGVSSPLDVESKKDKVVVVIATLIPRKRIIESIIFFKNNFENSGYKLYIIGPYTNPLLDGFDLEYVEKCLSYSSSNIIFTDSIDYEQVQSYLQKASHLLLFSLQEGMPNVVLEALSFGVFPVVTSMGGVSEEILGLPTNGLIVEEGELNKVIYIPSSNQKTVKKCRSHIFDNFCMKKIAILTYKQYCNLAKKVYEDK